MTTDRFIPPAAEGLPEGALDSATDGANALDARALDPYGRNFLAHALVQLARDGWLRTEPGAGFEPVRNREAPEPAAVPVPPTQTDRRAQLLDALDFAYCQGLGFDTPEALLDAYDVSRGVSVPPPADQTALRQRIAEALEQADYRYDMRRGDLADAVLAVLPEQTALPLTAVERQFLTFALGLAADEMASRGSEFGEDDEAALEKLRRVAAEEQPAETQRPLCPDPIECGHEAALGQVREAITFAERVVETSGPGPASAVQAVIDRLRAANPDRPAVGEQPETQEARPECAHCWREIENRGTPNMGGPPHDNWVHVPGGFTACFPQRGGDSPRAEPKTPE